MKRKVPMKKKDKLEPCPFCGEVPGVTVADTLKNFWVKCYNLKCSKNPETNWKINYDSPEEAIAAWNRRSPCQR